MSSDSLFPEITPFNTGLLSVSESHQLYFEECGNPNGFPVVFLHGGPGSGCSPTQRRFFDPNFYRIVLFDQRGCGRSIPAGETLDNTTQLLVEDIHNLKNHLNINQWLVFGGSWGSTLAIAYALAYPSHVSGLVLRGIFLSRPTELKWFLSEVNHFYPEVYHTLLTYVPKHEQSDLLSSYAKRVFSDDETMSAPAALNWNNFESQIMTLLPPQLAGEPAPSAVQIARARVQIHYIQHQCFLAERDIFSEVKTLAHIPTWIIQGRYDMVCPPVTAWELKQAMPHAHFTMVPDAGHSGLEKGICTALVAATEAFKHYI